MIADTWLLLSLRVLLAWNRFRARKPWQKVTAVLLTLWVGGWALFLSGAVGYGAGALLPRYPDAALDALLPGAILTAAMVLLVLSSFGMALGSLFLSSDLDLLMRAPVDRRAVFISKLLDGIALNYALVLVLGGPALLTYGLSLHYGPLYYVLALVALIGTPLLPEGLGALLVMLVARFAPARRVREVLGLAAALFGISCSLVGQTSRVWMGQFGSVRPDLHALRAQVESLAALPIPSLVAGRGLAAAGRGDWGGAVTGLAGFLLITFGFFAGCVWVADALYAAGWVRMQSAGSAKRSRQRAAQAAAHGGWLSRAPADLAVALKDWRVIPRDLRNFAQVLGPIVLLPIVYVNLLGGGGRRSFNALQAADKLTQGRVDPTGIFLAAGILLATVLVCVQVASTAISMEGKSWWILKIAPISGVELVRGKFLAAWLPFVVLSTVLLLGAAVWKGLSILGVLYGWFGIELLGAGMLAMSLGFGLVWPRLDWDNPKQMHSGLATFCSFVGEAVLGLIGGGLLSLPVILQVVAPAWAPAGWIVGILGAAALTGGLALAILQLGLRRLPGIGEG